MKNRTQEDPMQLFQLLYEEAVSRKIEHAEAMVLSTATLSGRPSGRVVLYKGTSDGGFVFFTNYKSRKGRELADNPFAAATFFWAPLGWQVRIEGRIERISAEDSDRYWTSRPRESQLSAYVSEQSQPIAAYEELSSQVAQAREKLEGREIPRPHHWGGYRLVPERIEFWNARNNRLHHRWFYRCTSEGWAVELLSP